MGGIEAVGCRGLLERGRRLGQCPILVQVPRREAGPPQRPLVLVAPATPVLQPSSGGTLPRSSAHHEDLDRGFPIGLLAAVTPDVAVEPIEVNVSEALQRGVGSEVDVSGMSQLGFHRPVSPGPDQHSHPVVSFCQPDVVVEGGPGVGVVPAADDQRGRVGEVVPVFARTDAGVLPVFVAVGVGQDFQGPAFVGGDQGQLCLAASDRHPGQPVVERGGSEVQGRVDPGVGFERGLGVGGRVPEGPGNESQFHRSALADGALVGVGTAHVGDHGHEIPGAQGRGGGLRPTHPRGAPGADPAVGPRLSVDPLERIEPVLGLGEQEIDVALGLVAASAVLDHADVAPRCEKAVVAHRRLDLVLVVGRPQQQRGQRLLDRLTIAGGAEDVGGQQDAIAGLDHHVPLDNHVKG